MASLSPPPKFAVTFVDDDGVSQPAIGYKLYSYTAGTSTPKDTYADITLGSANTNPVILDARGECDLWLNGAYKLILKTDLDETVWTVDEIRDPTLNPTFTNVTIAGTLTISSTAVTWSGNPTHSGNHIFSGNVTVNGNTRIGNAVSDTFTVETDTVTYTAGEVVHSGSNHTFSNDVTVDGATTVAALTYSGILTGPNGTVVDATWTPTCVAIDNVDDINPSLGQYAKIGKFITAAVAITIDATLTATQTNITISLPTGTTSSILQFAGRGSDSTGTAQGTIFGTGAATVQYRYVSTSTSTQTHWITFSGRID